MKSIQVDKNTIKKEKYSRMTSSQMREAQEKEADKETAEVLETGQDNEELGKKVVAEIESENEAAKQKKEDDFKTMMQSLKGRPASYKDTMASVLVDFLKILDWPHRWTADVVLTDGSPISIKGKGFSTQDGILLIITTPDGRVFHQGVRSSYDPVVDYMAMQTLAVQTENQLDKERGHFADMQQRTNTDPKIKAAPNIAGMSEGGIAIAKK